MLKTLVQFSQETAQQTQDTPAYADNVQLIQQLIADYTNFGEEQVTDITGYAASKAQVRKILTERTSRVMMALKSYAETMGDLVLLEKVNLVNSDLDAMRDEKLLLYSSKVKSLAEPMIASLSSYKVFQADLDELIVAHGMFDNVLRIPRLRQNDRREAIREAYEAISSSMNILRKRIEPIAQIIRLDDASWFKKYVDNTRIVDLSVQHTKIKGLVVDDMMQGLYRVKVTAITESGTFEALTDVNGNYEIRGIKQGDYQVCIEKDGFKKFETNYFRMKLGKTANVSCTLQSESAGLKKVA
jgi:hypothetical protein